MSLTNVEIETLAKKMQIPLEFVGYKDELLFMKPKMNRAYVINLEDEFDENGRRNDGSHWVCLLTNDKNAKSKGQYMYFDSYGCPAPKAIQNFVGMTKIPYNTKDMQGLLSSVCGYFCLALSHFVFASEHHTGDFYSDCNNYIDMFHDMNKNMDFYQNEPILRCFFQSANAAERVPIKNLHAITELNKEQIKALGNKL